MKKLIILILAATIAAGCSTTEETRQETPAYDNISLKNAFQVLLSDCLSTVDGYASFNQSEIYNLLDDSVKAYEGYLPLYDVLMTSYIQEIQDVAESSSLWALETLSNLEMALPENLSPYLKEEMIMEYIEKETRFKMEPLLSSHISTIMGNTNEKWNVFATECGIIKANYDNLNQLGFVLFLPEVKPITVAQISSLVLDKLYFALESTENYLKNRPLSENDNPAYSVFWQEV